MMLNIYAMAEISTNNASDNAGGKVRAKKLSTKIDMTPMVDLAFLLLTFFLLTTTFNKPHVMPLTMPEPVDDPTTLPRLSAKNAFSIVLAEDNKIYWWIGLDEEPKVTNYSHNGIRKIIFEKVRANPDLMLLIKPLSESTYANVVDMLDEVKITGVTRYAIVKVEEEDRQKIR